MHPSVGRCNHESGCGYHYTPKEYFQEHPEHRTTNDFSFDRQRAEQKKVKQQSKPTAIGYIPPHYVEKSQSERSNFFRFLFTLLTSYYGDKAKEVLKRLLEEYRLGATRDGSVIFWQIDRTGKVRTGKVMQYNPEDGHRIKGGQTSAVNWIHSILKKQRVLAEDWQLSQCLFGEHLLKTHPDKVVVLVESEKSAVKMCIRDSICCFSHSKSKTIPEPIKADDSPTFTRPFLNIVLFISSEMPSHTATDVFSFFRVLWACNTLTVCVAWFMRVRKSVSVILSASIIITRSNPSTLSLIHISKSLNRCLSYWLFH